MTNIIEFLNEVNSILEILNSIICKGLLIYILLKSLPKD